MSILAVHAGAEHAFSKPTRPAIRLLKGLGVQGDAHAGVTVRHRSRVAADPTQPNLRQVHLLHAELLEQLELAPGALGENVTTTGVDLLGLSAGSLLHLGPDAVVEVTGLRNPCWQINAYRQGLLTRVVGLGSDGQVERLAGVMAVVLRTGSVRAGDAVVVHAPASFVPLQRV